eukprot:PLAT3549.2.p1 GENE.PLAT3549.2~~PLAT3549.2.p1  ORF type:complete len:540 (+),score=131.79 PLAT3549.2:24-1643(+)
MWPAPFALPTAPTASPRRRRPPHRRKLQERRAGLAKRAREQRQAAEALLAAVASHSDKALPKEEAARLVSIAKAALPEETLPPAVSTTASASGSGSWSVLSATGSSPAASRVHHAARGEASPALNSTMAMLLEQNKLMAARLDALASHASRELSGEGSDGQASDGSHSSVEKTVSSSAKSRDRHGKRRGRERGRRRRRVAKRYDSEESDEGEAYSEEHDYASDYADSSRHSGVRRMKAGDDRYSRRISAKVGGGKSLRAAAAAAAASFTAGRAARGRRLAVRPVVAAGSTLGSTAGSAGASASSSAAPGRRPRLFGAAGAAARFAMFGGGGRGGGGGSGGGGELVIGGIDFDALLLDEGESDEEEVSTMGALAEEEVDEGMRRLEERVGSGFTYKLPPYRQPVGERLPPRSAMLVGASLFRAIAATAIFSSRMRALHTAKRAKLRESERDRLELTLLFSHDTIRGWLARAIRRPIMSILRVRWMPANCQSPFVHSARAACSTKMSAWTSLKGNEEDWRACRCWAVPSPATSQQRCGSAC